MRIAIIPARGGSKRVPRKNIRLFAGEPMIAYAIAAARNSSLFNHIVVSTDDDEIGQIARGLGAETPFRRPPQLADDHTPTVPVVAHALQACEALHGAIDTACCIYPGVPFIEPGDIVRGLEILSSSRAGYAFPVATYPSPIQRALRRDADGTTRPFDPQYARVRTQDLELAFHDAGQFYWGTREAWLSGTGIHENARTLVIPAWRVVDIDTPADWERAERMALAWRGAEPA